jgi:hypothetical protein
MHDNNLYWPIYRRIEQEILNLSFQISFDEYQLSVYSPKITGLILQIAGQIEAITTSLYKKIIDVSDIRNEKEYKKILNNSYCTGLKRIVKELSLQNLKVLITNPNIPLSEEKWEIKPFDAREKGWNNAYQKLKHNLYDVEKGRDKTNFQVFGTIKYLLDIASALLILNQYLLKDDEGKFTDYFPSDIFNVVFNGHCYDSFRPQQMPMIGLVGQD